jgi:hypothetical protein
MKSGTLGKMALNPGVYNNIYTVAVGNTAVVSLSVVNTDPVTDAKVRVAITDATSPSLGDHVEYDVTVMAGGGVLERTGLVLGASDKLFFRSDIAGVVARAYGYEEPSVQ